MLFALAVVLWLELVVCGTLDECDVLFALAVVLCDELTECVEDEECEVLLALCEDEELQLELWLVYGGGVTVAEDDDGVIGAEWVWITELPLSEQVVVWIKLSAEVIIDP